MLLVKVVVYCVIVEGAWEGIFPVCIPGSLYLKNFIADYCSEVTVTSYIL
jgi:hypothetical protein